LDKCTSFSLSLSLNSPCWFLVDRRRRTEKKKKKENFFLESSNHVVKIPNREGKEGKQEKRKNTIFLTPENEQKVKDKQAVLDFF